MRHLGLPGVRTASRYQKVFDHVARSGAAKTLVGEPPRRLLADMQWDPANPVPLSNLSQLIINGVCRAGNSYFHGEKFTGGQAGQWKRDAKLIEEAPALLKEAQNSHSTSLEALLLLFR